MLLTYTVIWSRDLDVDRERWN